MGGKGVRVGAMTHGVGAVVCRCWQPHDGSPRRVGSERSAVDGVGGKGVRDAGAVQVDVVDHVARQARTVGVGAGRLVQDHRNYVGALHVRSGVHGGRKNE